MDDQEHSLQDLQHIRKMMENSSRFISLSGLSGVAAGVCALVGAYVATQVMKNSPINIVDPSAVGLGDISLHALAGSKLIMIAIVTFITAFFASFLFTYLRSKRNNIPVWGPVAKRLLISVAIPMVAGGLYIFREIQLGHFGLVAPGCLIFYGLALVNASKYTLGEIRFLGYLQIVLGIINCWFIGYGLYFWATGFGILHIIYGLFMWQKYERGADRTK